MTADSSTPSDRRSPSPRPSTLAKIRQFARCYACTSDSLPPSLAGFTMN
ncbi:MAG: hypothetical protein K2L62_01855 [Muribaculaceae bacterium]|nr:hypothetical protein [Muribaculaceae bacterium]